MLGKSPEAAVIQARECWATNTADPDGHPMYSKFMIIQDYCAVNENLDQSPKVNIAKNGESTVAEWTWEALQFPEKFENIYLHCYANICFDFEGNGSCNKVPCQNRKRRGGRERIGHPSKNRNVLQKYFEGQQYYF